MTADGFDQTVDAYLGSWSQFKQTANTISAAVQGYNESYASWNIAYDQISSKVWNDDVSSYISQHADSISSVVAQHLEDNDYFDSFVNHQDLVAYATKNELSSYATVSSLNEYATNSRVDQLSDKISLSVTKQQFTDTLASYTTKSYISTWIIDPLNDLNGQIIDVNDKLDTISLAGHITYSANIIDSYASIDINGYLNASVDLFIWKDGSADDGEGNVILTHEAISNAIVWAYLPDGLVESGNPYKVNVIDNTNEYKDVSQFTEIDKTKAKGNLRLDIQIPN